MGAGAESLDATRRGPVGSTTWAALRTTVVWDALCSVLPSTSQADRWLVIDAGGGTGGLAVPLAELGHNVIVVDPSPDSLAALERRAGDRSVAARVRWVQGDLSQLGELAERGTLPEEVDLVLCHSVLELTDDPWASLASAARSLRVGGILSVLVATRGGAVVSRALAGQFDAAAAILESDQARWDGDTLLRRFDRQAVVAAIADLGFVVETVHGVRVLSDLVAGVLLDSDPAASRRLLDLERSLSVRQEFLDLATQLHIVARKQ